MAKPRQPDPSALKRANKILKGKKPKKSFAQKQIDKAGPKNKPVEFFWLTDELAGGAI